MSDYNADPNPDLDKIHQVAFVYGLARQTNLKVDQFSTGSSKKVYTINRRIESTRLKILVEPDDIPS